ncbi:MAG: hypothetical protein ABIU63_13360 [Chitinophagaceae bacterium]
MLKENLFYKCLEAVLLQWDQYKNYIPAIAFALKKDRLCYRWGLVCHKISFSNLRCVFFYRVKNKAGKPIEISTVPGLEKHTAQCCACYPAERRGAVVSNVVIDF